MKWHDFRHIHVKFMHCTNVGIEDASPEVARLIAGLGRTGIVGLTEACHRKTCKQFCVLGVCHA